jgi:hypothetical protein
MKARIWFEARGRSARSRGLTCTHGQIALVGGRIAFAKLPKWASQAFCSGYFSQGLEHTNTAVGGVGASGGGPNNG